MFWWCSHSGCQCVALLEFSRNDLGVGTMNVDLRDNEGEELSIEMKMT